jgi:hypothetical protein
MFLARLSSPIRIMSKSNCPNLTYALRLLWPPSTSQYTKMQSIVHVVGVLFA